MKLSVIFPVKNQTAKLIENLRKIGLPYYDKLGIPYEFLIVSDGSDEPNQKALELALKDLPDTVKLLPYENKLGKGHNVQKGFLAAQGDYVMFMDADFATDLSTLEKILPEIDRYDAFCASRHCAGAEILSKQSFSRRVISGLSRLLIHQRFHFKDLHDTQCGYKLFRADVAKLLAKKQKIDGFAFDVEYLYMLQLNGYTYKEVPCVWKDDPSSSMGNPLKASIKFFFDMGQVKKHKDSYVFTQAERGLVPVETKEAEKTPSEKKEPGKDYAH